MTTGTVGTRDRAHQRHLMAVLGRVRIRLEASEATDGEGPVADRVEEMDREIEELRTALPGPSPLEVVCRTFGLSDFERDVLLLCAGVELDAPFARAVAVAGDGPPTFGLALAALPGAHWSALAPDAPLRRWRLVETGSGDRLVAAPLRIDERVLHYLVGVQGLDEQLRGFVHPLASGAEPPLSTSQERVAERLTAAWRASSTAPLPVPQLLGPESECRAVGGAVAARLGMTLHGMASSVIPAGPHEQEVLVRLWERESVLGGRALLVEVDRAGATEPQTLAPVRRFVEATNAPVLLSTSERISLSHRRTLVFPVTRATSGEQRRRWQDLAGPRRGELNGELDRIVGQFDLPFSSIEAAWAQANEESDPGVEDEGGGLGSRLWDACRSQARPRLSDLAQTIEPVATWDDLVLPELQSAVLRQIVVQVRQRSTVYESWGFAARSSRGLGISALFTGPSGTGKTMAAEVLAGELELDLYRIDLSRVVNKYIGETEKNLARVFDAAEEGGAILLFDEADALFGKRSEVKDSHDRYANIEVSYLLQRMEAYRGLAILTSNLKGALDEAFLRRLRFIVSFPFPDAAHRTEIWRRIFPAETPTEALEPDKLGRLNVTGGSIRNIALGAAFLAADAGRPVRMEDMLRAARTEYLKLERPLTDAEIRGWL